MAQAQSLTKARSQRQGLWLEGRQDLLLKAHAVVSICLLAVVGLFHVPLPFVVGVIAFSSYMNFLVLRIRLGRTVATEETEETISGLHRQIERTRAAIFDGHIGLHQRWYMEWRLKQECARCRRYGLSLALVAVKLDGLHEASEDAWLAEATRAADVTANAVRNVDMAAELTPTEFALSLVHCDALGAVAAMQRLANELQAYSVQMGYVVFPEDEGSPTELIELARARLEPVKRSLLPAKKDPKVA
jgi:GGDEF domain-containing protein